MAAMTKTLGPVSWERMSAGIEKVKERLTRTCRVLDDAGVDYAVIGGNAVAAWVSRVDESVVRNTRGVDILVRRDDLSSIKEAMTEAGFIHKSVSILDGKGRIEMFLDGPRAKARDAVHLIFADEKVSDRCVVTAPKVTEIDHSEKSFRLLSLEALVRMKLNSFRRKDQVHLLDMMEIGQIDSKWLEKVPEELRSRLQELLDDPWG